MKRVIVLLFVALSLNVPAQNLIPIPDTLTGTTFSLTIHSDSVQFLPGIKTLTNAFNQYSYLGPTLILNQNDIVTMNVTNNLTDTTTVHWHGVHVPAMADGGPHTLILAGTTWNPQFKVMNHASTFWYHPHTHMKTGQQAMRGAAGLIIVRDSIESTLTLPKHYGIDDFPIIVQSQQFDSANQILWRGMRDSTLLVNGTERPMLNLPSQVVRMRLLNASQERNFNFGFTGNYQFYVIGNDGGLLNSPVPVTRIRLSPGERAEILINLTGMSGQIIYLMSYASEFPTGVQGGIPMPGMGTSMDSPLNGVDFNILQLNVLSQTANPVTTIPASLVTVTPWLQSESNTTRNILITAQSIMNMDGPFYFNGLSFDMNRIDYHIPLNNIEIWSISNQSMVAHPFHIHDVQFFILDRDGISARAEERGFKDVVMIAPQETVRFITKFEDFADTTMPYMFHCHNLMHEDDGMMGQFVVVPNTTTINEINAANNLIIYPNPISNGAIHIRFEELQTSKAEFIVSNLLGQNLIHSFTSIDNHLIEIDLSTIQSGTYILKIITGQQLLFAKIVKQ